jgi:hypothetical protein
MRHDWSWERVAGEYEKVYAALIRGDFARSAGSQNRAGVLP